MKLKTLRVSMYNIYRECIQKLIFTKLETLLDWKLAQQRTVKSASLYQLNTSSFMVRNAYKYTLIFTLNWLCLFSNKICITTMQHRWIGIVDTYERWFHYCRCCYRCHYHCYCLHCRIYTTTQMYNAKSRFGFSQWIELIDCTFIWIF